MQAKPVSDAKPLQNKHSSLSVKMFRLVIQFALVLSVISIAFGFGLYIREVTNQYTSNAKNVAKTAKIILNENDGYHYIDDVLEIYNNSTIDFKDDAIPQEYLDQYESLQDSTYRHMQDLVMDVRDDNEASAVYVAIYDRKNNRLLYVLDTERDDPQYCPTGSFDIASERAKRAYNGTYEGAPSLVEKETKYGYILTSWEPIRSDDDYLVAVFTDYNMADVAKTMRNFLIQYCLLLAIVTLAIAYYVVQRLRRNVIKPITDINDAARSFITARGRNLLNDESYFANVDVHTKDEIESLALIMADMERDVKENVRNLEAATVEKERMGAELNIASQIQEGVLPSVFPPFPDHKEFDIYALMDPAKEVGGDFYDFFLLDKTHLALVIADVSGKGIPAALFMMGSKIIINNTASMGIYDPATILQIVNKQIVKSNPADMFVTVWLGILDTETGIIKAANAGHEYPCITQQNGQFNLLRDKHGLIIGGLDDCEYTTYQIHLDKGDCLFVYTDGVSEATNAENELFGDQRLLQALNKNSKASCEELLMNVKDAIEEFVVDAPQFDDITMLALRYRGDDAMNELTTEALIENIPEVTAFVDEKLEALDCPLKVQTQIDIAIDELFSNIANYAYHPEVGPATVRVEVEKDPMAVVITFIDHGKPYDPLSVEDPDTTLGAEEREVGGLGVFLVKKTMDDVAYEYKDGKNILKIKKHL